MEKKRLDLARFSSKSNKKGQVTLFIILGILLLLVLVLAVVFRKELISIKPEEIIPTEKGKVESYLTTCLDQLGNEALQRVGLQGGYVYLPAEISKDLNRHLKTAPFSVVPYWAVGANTYITPLPQIKADIDRYIEENLRSCLFGLSAFNESYEITERSDIEANTEIVERKVLFNVHWDIEVREKSGEVVAELINHAAESPVKLKWVYDLAQGIIEKEMQDLKLEDLTQDLIALEHPDVPVAGTELSCSQKTWEISKVRQSLLKLVNVNIRELKIKGTEFVEFPEELPYYESHYIWDIGEEYSNPEISARFRFEENYPYTFAVTPASGSKLKSSPLGGQEMISFLCLQNWKFTYDLTYPVLVTVRDETTGYDFQFAFTVHLYRNNPYRGFASSRAYFALDTVSDEDYCANRKIPLTVKTYEIVDNGQGVSNREDLSGVNISLTCLKYSCSMGETQYDLNGQGFAGLQNTFPYCVGGILRGEKEFYQEAWQRIVTKASAELELNLIPLKPISQKEIKVIKHKFLGPENIGPGEEMTEEEMALIKWSYQSGNETDFPFNHEVTLAKSAALQQAEEPVTFLAKADFIYALDVKLLDQEKIIGGYEANWLVPWSELENAEQITIHVLSVDNPSEEESIALLAGLKENSVYLPLPEIK